MKLVILAAILGLTSCADSTHNSSGTLISYARLGRVSCQPFYSVCVGLVKVDGCYSGIGLTEGELHNLLGKKVKLQQQITGTGFSCSRHLTIKEVK